MTSFSKAREAAAKHILSAHRARRPRLYDLMSNQATDYVDVALSAFEEAGFVLVPCKHKNGDTVMAGLTPAMYHAFWKRFDEAFGKHGDFEATNAAYNAMIAAAIAERQK